jgi:hypothetical protein
MAVPSVVHLEAPKKGKVLTSWKEIAGYMGCGVRTIQRYERQYRLPVRRLTGKARGAVFAIPSEIDAWLLFKSDRKPGAELPARIFVTVTTVHASVEKGTELRRRCGELLSAHHQALESLNARLKSLLAVRHDGSAA